ncbi:hypothetical protein AF335_02660 [Streptomyces eurocidicus]|uniref:Uncharacterized protein n=1 Tax=Streptomyces eurocidicus TaxID=66423 RepID=A0A2N8P2P2_STREU|nr:DUF6255 family natural product biosynthesis protein [Streptomyces eurocidicus]MBB5117427.1 hypothetical protein [Streptomyces eurocidicus]MBF6053272.1 hypothetical protein [Streptomyces eurocidicus]PNE35283.1 hypothetical protein AF335_02660 [Streptomyces eurocidicus]
MIARVLRSCAHRFGRSSARGESRCGDCGTRRFTGYAALLLPEAPWAVTLSAPERWAADRSAAGNIAAGARLTRNRT